MGKININLISKKLYNMSEIGINSNEINYENLYPELRNINRFNMVKK